MKVGSCKMVTSSENSSGDEGNNCERKNSAVPVRLEVKYEILSVLPESFLHGYEQLWVRMSSGRTRERVDPDAATAKVPSGARVRTDSNQVDARGGARAGGKRAGVSSRNVISDMRAAALKARVDRKLRVLARDMLAFLEGSGSVNSLVRRCTRCKGWAEDTWNYCPRDGAPTEQVDG